MESDRARPTDLSEWAITTMTDESRQDLKSYYDFYCQHNEAHRAIVIPFVQHHEIFKVLIDIVAGSTELGTQHRDEVSRCAVYDDEWEPYVRSTTALAMHLARKHVPHHSWFELLRVVRNSMTELIINQNMDDAQRSSILRGMGTMHDIGMACVANGYEAIRLASLERETTRYHDCARRLSHIQKLSHIGDWELDFNTNITSWSDEMFRILGYVPGEVATAPESYLSRVHPEDIESITQVIANAMDGGESESGTHRVVWPDGTEHMLYADTKMEYDELGRPRGMHGILHDITERHEAETSLRQTTSELMKIKNALEYRERRLKQAQEITHHGNWELSFETRLATWSDEACRIYGLSPENNIHSFDSWHTYLHPDDVEFVDGIINSSRASHADTSFRHRIVRADGVVRHLQGHTNFEFGDGEVPTGLYGVLHDITDAVKAEEALVDLNTRLNDRAEELALSNAELEQFAYVASHDLQEPLRMVTSFLTQLQSKYRGQLDAKAHQYIHFAVDGAVRMRAIILDLLEYSRVGRGNFDVEFIDVDALLREIVHLGNTAIKESHAGVEWGPMPTVVAVRTPLQRVFQNLIGNALKYRRADVIPEVRITASESSSEWQFSVSDNGIGIDPRFFEKIFIAFQRLHSKDEYSGSGIGLSICYQIVAKHKGRMWVDSAEGQGSTFFFTINKAYTTGLLKQ